MGENSKEMISVNYAESELFQNVKYRLYSFDVLMSAYLGKLHGQPEFQDAELKPEMRPFLWIIEDRRTSSREEIGAHMRLQTDLDATMESLSLGLSRVVHLAQYEQDLQPLFKAFGKIPEHLIEPVVNEVVTKVSRSLETLISGERDGKKVDEPMLPMLWNRDLEEMGEEWNIPDAHQRFLDSASLAVIGAISDLLEEKTGRALPYQNHPKYARYFAEGADIPEEFRVSDTTKVDSDKSTSIAAVDPSKPMTVANQKPEPELVGAGR